MTTYYTCQYDDYAGYEDISKHTTLRTALAHIRRQMSNSTAERGMIFENVRPTGYLSDRMPKGLIGIVVPRTKRAGSGLKEQYIYLKRVKYKSSGYWPEYIIMSDGSLTKL